MCGIAGIFDTRERRPMDEALARRMRDVQQHRGPDEEGLHLEPGLALAHRRLSIIDLKNGQQPFFTRDATVCVSYNGEIYNFKSVRAELERLGYRFDTNCDTEVIVYAWQEWQERCVHRFRGMFVFALWDHPRQTLFLVRDRLGIKPLYYGLLEDGCLIFASELKGLVVHPSLRRDLDERAVEDYFAFGYVPDPKTIYRGVHKLEAGHWLKVERGKPLPAPVRYWDVPFKVAPVNGLDVSRAFVDKLREAVDIRLIADVPLGAFLSGGIDSSTVVSMMAGLVSGPVNTCSISFGEPRFDESGYASRVARQYATNHYVENVDPDDIELVDRLTDFYDEPFADASAIPTYRLCELARKRVTVALSGDGGDENLAGYRRYRLHMNEERVRSAIPAELRARLFGPLGRLYPKADWAPRAFRAKTTLQSLAMSSMEAYFHSVSVFSDEHRGRLFSGDFKRDLQGYRAIGVLGEHARRAPTDHPLSLVQYLDIKCFLAGDILPKVDRASMAHSLEVRVPFLDHELVEWVSSLPPELKLNGQSGKDVLKKAMASSLPSDILYRPKMGFDVPLAKWFRGPLREHLRSRVLGPSLPATGIFDGGYLSELVDDHQSGRRDNSTFLWPLLMFDSFIRKSL